MGSDWYYAREGEQAGPVSAPELKRLASSGRLLPEDLVWQEGMKEWTAARQVKGLFDAAPTAGARPEAPPVVSTPPLAVTESAAPDRSRRLLFEVLFDLARPSFGSSFLQATARLFSLVGHWGLVLAMGLALLWSILAAVKNDQYGLLGLGPAIAVALAVLQYWARRLLPPLPPSDRPAPGRLGSPGPLECVAAMASTAGLVALVSLTIAALDRRILLAVLPGMAAFTLGQYTAVLALNAKALGLVLGDEGIGPAEQLLGLLSWVGRAAIQIAPVAFGVGAGWTVLALAYAILALFAPDLTWHGTEPLGELTVMGLMPIGLLLAPLWCYLTYLASGCMTELLSAMLAVPSKLDVLAKFHSASHEES